MALRTFDGTISVQPWDKPEVLVTIERQAGDEPSLESIQVKAEQDGNRITVEVVKPGPEWDTFVIVPEDGQTLRAIGGEKVYGYQTIDGGRAEGFELQAGDSATLVRSGLSYALVEWRIERE